MDSAAALSIAEREFPNGPERIAEALGAEIVYESINVDGWCLTFADRPLITLNRDAPRTRQRFTLAHEVAHLILGTQTDLVGRGDTELYNSRSPDERAANKLAKELLLPMPCLRRLLTWPIDPRVIASAAKHAGVSEVVLTQRLALNSSYFRISHPTVAKIEYGTTAWRFPDECPISSGELATLYDRARREGGTARTVSRTNEPVLGCALSNPTYPILFAYILPEVFAEQETPTERRRRLENTLFAGVPNLQIRLNGCFGAFKPLIQGRSLGEAVTMFHERYAARLTQQFGDKYPSPLFDE
jgi:hypothetical protein